MSACICYHIDDQVNVQWPLLECFYEWKNKNKKYTKFKKIIKKWLVKKDSHSGQFHQTSFFYTTHIYWRHISYIWISTPFLQQFDGCIVSSFFKDTDGMGWMGRRLLPPPRFSSAWFNFVATVSPLNRDRQAPVPEFYCRVRVRIVRIIGIWRLFYRRIGNIIIIILLLLLSTIRWQTIDWGCFFTPFLIDVELLTNDLSYFWHSIALH